MSDDSGLHRKLHAHGLRVAIGTGGLAKVVVPGEHQAEIYLHGAHLTSWQPKGAQPVLWMSSKSSFADGKPIRGGVPICFPWFGPHATDATKPMHGFARLRAWTLEDAERLPDGRVRLHLAFESDEATRALWPHGFAAAYFVTIGATLELELAVENTSTAELQIGEALHTYFAVGDARRIAIHGLSGAPFLDKTRGMQRFTEERPVVSLAGETDRQYLTDARRCVIEDPALGRRIFVEKSGSGVTVVWNPWTERAKAMPDFDAERWPEMVCVETANSADRLARIAPGATHRLSARIAIEPLS
jgi:glucose-6-phosphate 1-epimerase